MDVSSVPAASAINVKDLVFDPDFYYNRYPDLQKAFGHDVGKLANHWKEFGIKEGRQGSEAFDIRYYVEKYPDLQKAFGSDYTRVYNHFFEFGLKEMRRTSKTYDPKVYKECYPFLSSLEPAQLLYHFLKIGHPKGLLGVRKFHKIAVPAPSGDPKDILFDVEYYYNRYPDLQKAFGHDVGKLAKHWKEFGIKEGRQCCEALDPHFYVEKYPDLQKAFGTDYTRIYNHFFEFGMKENRQSSRTFDPKVYKQRYGLKIDGIQLIHHFLTYGMKHYMVAV